VATKKSSAKARAKPVSGAGVNSSDAEPEQTAAPGEVTEVANAQSPQGPIWVRGVVTKKAYYDNRLIRKGEKDVIVEVKPGEREPSWLRIKERSEKPFNVPEPEDADLED
jgi:hypothetical protein